MSTRRLPVYLLLDTSGSMNGEPIAAVNNGLRALKSSLLHDPQALDSVHLSVITFDREAKVILPLTALESADIPELQPPQSGPTHLGEGLELVRRSYQGDVVVGTSERKGDWAPFLFVMTDGGASDRQKFLEEVPRITSLGFQSRIGCLAGHAAKADDLTLFCDPVLHLDTMDAHSFLSLFQWVSSAITGKNRSMGAVGDVELPPIPAEISLV